MYVEILILAHLARQPAHGYEIKRSVEQTLGDAYPINNNQLYPALRRFEEMGAVAREVERQVGRPDRHIFHMTDRGQDVLEGLLRTFPPELARDDAEFAVRLAFFHLLDPQARLVILRTRESVLRNWVAHLRHSHELVRSRPEMAFAARLLTFNEEQIDHELSWIATLTEETESEV